MTSATSGLTEGLTPGIEALNLQTGTSTNLTSSLPEAKRLHCAVDLGENRIMFLGGATEEYEDGTRDVDILDVETGEWSQGPRMRQRRSGLACGRFVGADGTVRVMVVGGRFSSETTEIYSVKVCCMS